MIHRNGALRLVGIQLVYLYTYNISSDNDYFYYIPRCEHSAVSGVCSVSPQSHHPAHLETREPINGVHNTPKYTDHHAVVLILTPSSFLSYPSPLSTRYRSTCGQCRRHQGGRHGPKRRA